MGRILVLQTQGDELGDLVPLLGKLGEVQVEKDLAGALSALAGSSYSLVIGTPAELMNAARSASQKRLGLVLDSIGQGVCIIDLNGDIAWSNTRLDQFPQEVRERIRRHCLDIYSKADPANTSLRSRGLSLSTEGEQYFEVTLTPVVDQEEGTIYLIAAVTDVTRARRLQRKMDAIDNAGREIVRVDTDKLARMDVRQRLELLEQKILRFTHELLHFDNFGIRLLDKGSNKLELVLCAGLPPEAQQIDIYMSTENSGISGYVAATGRSYICADVRNDTRYLTGISNAQSSLTVPLWLHDQVIGILNIESDRLTAFSEDDRQFAEIFGRYIAMALHILDLLVVERHTTTGRLADNVSAEIAGPLGDILADASTLMEDYIGHDDLRHRLQTICDNVVRIRECIREVTKPVGGILGSKPVHNQADPLLDGKSVLVADDEEVIRLAVRDVLSKYGCEVELARDGTEALAMLNRRGYDLVLSDIRMPGKNGYEIFDVVKSRTPNCPVIFMTGFGYDPNHCVIRARQEGLASVLYKPFKVDQLLGDVRAAISAAAEK